MEKSGGQSEEFRAALEHISRKDGSVTIDGIHAIKDAEPDVPDGQCRPCAKE